LTTKTTQEIRELLAVHGTELTPEALNDVLQAMACCAECLGGEVWLDIDTDWSLYVALDEENPGECWVDLVKYEYLPDPGQEMN
jgi:hypothetical protein